jgi:SOS response regulatory protein OraA/RecX
VIINYCSFAVAWLRGQVPGQDPLRDIFNQKIEVSDSSKIEIARAMTAPSIDPEAVEKALADFGTRAHKQEHLDPHAFADALIANERLKSQSDREKKKSALDTDITDLVLGGAEALWQFLRR